MDDENERPAKNTDNEQVHKEQPGKVRRFRVYPSTKPKKTLRKWFGTARWTHNQCLDAVEKKESVRTKKGLRRHSYIRRQSTRWASPGIWKPHTTLGTPPWMTFSKHMIPHMHGTKKDNNVFRIKGHSRTKSRRESIVIHHKHWFHGRGPYAFLRKMNSAEPF
ncbi:hypothetical protein V1527DRAFT_464112, partial [Lipomyces starkeyi]